MGKTKTVHAYFHDKEYELPLEAIEDICQQGANDEAVECWSKYISLNVSRKDLIDGLAETGGWTREKLGELSKEELKQKALWIIASDAHENLEE